jgi:hypothetical protein
MRLFVAAFWMMGLRVMDAALAWIFLSAMVKPIGWSTGRGGLSEDQQAQAEENNEQTQELCEPHFPLLPTRPSLLCGQSPTQGHVSATHLYSNLSKHFNCHLPNRDPGSPLPK